MMLASLAVTLSYKEEGGMYDGEWRTDTPFQGSLSFYQVCSDIEEAFIMIEA